MRKLLSDYDAGGSRFGFKKTAKIQDYL